MIENFNAKYLKRLLVDMHIPDWNKDFMVDYSPDRMAEYMKKANTDVAQFAAGSCLGLCFWPTKIGYAHKCMAGRDFLKDTLNAYNSKGMPTQLFLNTWNRAAYDAHPEWRMVMPDGKGTVDGTYDNGRFGLCCHNSSYREFFMDLLKELVPQYKTDAYWVDMVGWWNVICKCPSCQKKFGRKIPDVIDWNDPEWCAFAKFREDTLNDFVKDIRDTIKSIAPHCAVAFQTGSFHMGWSGGGNTPGFYRCGDYLAHDLTGEKFEQIYCSKMYTALSKTHPVEFMVSRCIHLSHHTTSRSPEEINSIAYAAVANQTSFTLIDAIDPAGTLDDRFYGLAADVFDKYSKYEKYISSESVPVGDCAIYYSQDSQVEVRVKCSTLNSAEAAAKIPKRFANIAKALSEKHILFSFADVESDLSCFNAVILSDCCRMNDAECEQIRQYVANGGKIYASADTSLFDPANGMRKDFALTDVFGVSTDGDITQQVTYIAPTEIESVLSKYCRPTFPVMLAGCQTKIKSANAQVLGTLTLPVSEPTEKNRFGSALSNPPVIRTENAALTLNKYGKGEALYCAGRLEENEYQFHHNIFADIIAELSGKMISTDAPAWVETTLFELPSEKRLLLSFLNRPADLPPAPLFGIDCTVKLPAKYQIKELLLAPEEKVLPFERTADGIRFKLDKVTDFAMVVISFE